MLESVRDLNACAVDLSQFDFLSTIPENSSVSPEIDSNERRTKAQLHLSLDLAKASELKLLLVA